LRHIQQPEVIKVKLNGKAFSIHQKVLFLFKLSISSSVCSVKQKSELHRIFPDSVEKACDQPNSQCLKKTKTGTDGYSSSRKFDSYLNITAGNLN